MKVKPGPASPLNVAKPEDWLYASFLILFWRIVMNVHERAEVGM